MKVVFYNQERDFWWITRGGNRRITSYQANNFIEWLDWKLVLSNDIPESIANAPEYPTRRRRGRQFDWSRLNKKPA